ncbi:serine hydrolase [Streptomyces sp. NPDC048723]|uniref:serine hydrolase n=1 Tax=Streptomyces sp. NPDC048723 TaxID=3365589 RepID=UPI003713D00C
MKAVTVAGGSSDDPEIEAESTVLEGEPKATAEAEAGVGAKSEGRAEPEGDAVAEADAEPGGEAAPQAGPQGGADSESPGETEPEAEADPEVESEPGSSEAEADAERAGEADVEFPGEARPETDTEPKAEAQGEGDPKAAAESEHTGEADAGLPGEAHPETDTAPEAETKAPADPAAEAESERAGEAQPEAEAETDAEPEGSGEADAGLPGEARSETDTAPEGDVDLKATADSEPELAGEAQPEAEAEAEAETDAEPEGSGEADAGLPGEARSETDTAPEAEGNADLKATADSEPELAGEARPGTGAEGEGEAGPDVTARSEAEAEAGSEDEAGVGERPGADTDGDDDRVDDRVDEQPDGGPEPEAQGADAPGAETGGEAAADETMLIALPKQKPTEPDAPRKAPAWARETEPDPERTSQFVALKDVDLPPPVAPRAQPQPTEAKVAAPVPAAPLPPLDLLAELTNTPAPAETPRRTALRRVKIGTPILLLLAGAGVGAQLLRPLPTPQLVAAEADRTIDGQFSIPWPVKGQGAVRLSGSGDIGTFGEQKPVPTASVAKVMTAYVILKGHPLRKSDPGPEITVDAKTVADGTSEHESRISGLTVGQKFSQQDMLKMLMIPSGNNIARLLARWETGTDSEAAFVGKMNAAAKELGMENTTYTDPSGLDAGTVSTAADQLKLAEAVMKDETFRSIVALPNATIKGLPQRLENNNTLLTAQGLSVRGIKTGSSTPAGGTLMWAAYKSIGDEDPLILGTLMDQRVDGPDPDAAYSLKLVLANSKKIIEAVRNALASAPVVRKGDIVGYVDDGLGGRTPLVATKDLNVIGVPGQQVKLSLTTGAGAGAGPLPHTAKAGSEVAVLTVGSGEGARSVPVAVKGALAEPSFGTRLTRGR